MEKWALKIGLTLPLDTYSADKGVPLALTSGEGVPLASRSVGPPATGGSNDHTRAELVLNLVLDVVMEMKVPPVIENEGATRNCTNEYTPGEGRDEKMAPP